MDFTKCLYQNQPVLSFFLRFILQESSEQVLRAYIVYLLLKCLWHLIYQDKVLFFLIPINVCDAVGFLVCVGFSWFLSLWFSFLPGLLWRFVVVRLYCLWLSWVSIPLRFFTCVSSVSASTYCLFFPLILAGLYCFLLCLFWFWFLVPAFVSFRSGFWLLCCFCFEIYRLGRINNCCWKPPALLYFVSRHNS